MAAQKALRSLKELSERFPDESALYADGIKLLAPAHPPTSAQIAYPARAAHSADDPEHDALQNIRQFVGEDSPANDAHATSAVDGPQSSSPDPEEMKTLYVGLLRGIRGKEKEVTDQQGRCGALLRDAVADKSALGRSLKRVAAKLHIAQTTMAEYKQGVAYNSAQSKVVRSDVERLSTLVTQVKSQSSQAADRLNTFAQQLISLASSMDQQDQSPDGHAKRMRDLVQKVEEHRALLQQRARHFQESSAAVDAADRSLLRVLEDESRRSGRQVERLKAEAELLASRHRAKAGDQALTERFDQLVQGLCSEGQLQTMQHKTQELKLEEQFLSKAFPAPVTTHV